VRLLCCHSACARAGVTRVFCFSAERQVCSLSSKRKVKLSTYQGQPMLHLRECALMRRHQQLVTILRSLALQACICHLPAQISPTTMARFLAAFVRFSSLSNLTLNWCFSLLTPRPLQEQPTKKGIALTREQWNKLKARSTPTFKSISTFFQTFALPVCRSLTWTKSTSIFVAISDCVIMLSTNRCGC